MNREKLNTNVIQEGEVTGHAHRLNGTIGKEFQLYRNGDVLELEMLADVPVTHEEHKPVSPFEVGTEFEIDIVQEFDHEANEKRNVVD